jgi:hypothetical protein
MGSSIISTSEKDTCLLLLDDDDGDEWEIGERLLEPNEEMDESKFIGVDDEVRDENDMMSMMYVCMYACEREKIL